MPEKQVKRIKVKLKKTHTHAGIDYLPGAEIEITETQAKALESAGII